MLKPLPYLVFSCAFIVILLALFSFLIQNRDHESDDTVEMTFEATQVPLPDSTLDEQVAFGGGTGREVLRRVWDRVSEDHDIPEEFRRSVDELLANESSRRLDAHYPNLFEQRLTASLDRFVIDHQPMLDDVSSGHHLLLRVLLISSLSVHSTPPAFDREQYSEFAKSIARTVDARLLESMGSSMYEKYQIPISQGNAWLERELMRWIEALADDPLLPAFKGGVSDKMRELTLTSLQGLEPRLPRSESIPIGMTEEEAYLHRLTRYYEQIPRLALSYMMFVDLGSELLDTPWGYATFGMHPGIYDGFWPTGFRRYTLIQSPAKTED